MDLNKLNEYGILLHACNGHRQDEHYWSWLGYKRLQKETDLKIEEPWIHAKSIKFKISMPK